MSRKNAMVSLTGKPRRTRRMTERRPPQKSASVTAALVTLQRAAAAHENLRAEMACAVDKHDAAVRMKPL